MPAIFIPPLGSIIQLERDWEFRLYDEHRNDSLQKAAGLYSPHRQCLSRYLHQDVSLTWRDMSLADRAAECLKSGWFNEKHKNHSLSDYWSGDWSHDFVFREGTELKFDRIYLRQGQSAYDSVTFRTNCWMSSPGDPLFTASRKLKSLRFWAKLEDVNLIIGRYVSR